MFRFELFEGGVFLFFIYSYYSYPGLRRMGWVLSGSPVQRDNMFFWERVSSISRHPGKPPRKGPAQTRARNPHFYWRGRRRGGRTGAADTFLFAGRPFISPPGRHRADVVCDLSHFRSVFLIAAGGDNINPNPSGSWPSTRPGRCSGYCGGCSALLCSALWLPPEEKGMRLIRELALLTLLTLLNRAEQRVANAERVICCAAKEHCPRGFIITTATTRCTLEYGVL